LVPFYNPIEKEKKMPYIPIFGGDKIEKLKEAFSPIVGLKFLISKVGFQPPKVGD